LLRDERFGFHPDEECALKILLFKGRNLSCLGNKEKPKYVILIERMLYLMELRLTSNEGIAKSLDPNQESWLFAVVLDFSGSYEFSSGISLT
jgi:hypothetical protein